MAQQPYITINSFPDVGDSAISDVEIRINGGTVNSLGAVAPGVYPLTGVSYNDTVDIRARNNQGAIDWASAYSFTMPGQAPTQENVLVATGTFDPGQTIGWTPGTYQGVPAPTVSYAATLDGVDVKADLNLATNEYTIPTATTGENFVLTETATNGVGSGATQQFTRTIGGSSLLLDAYTGAKAAYSFRALSTATTNVCQLRRGGDNALSDFTETALTDGSAETWANGGDGNAYLQTWYDQAGSLDMQQATNASQPLVISAGSLIVRGTKPTAAFDGSDDFLITATEIFTGNLWSIFVTADLALANTGESIITQYGSTSSLDNRSVLMGMSNGTAGRIQTFVNAGGASSSGEATTIAANDFGIYESRALSNNYDLAKNNGSFETVISGVSFTPIAGSTELGSVLEGTGSGFFLVARLSEVVIWESDQTANRTGINTDIAGHFGITLA